MNSYVQKNLKKNDESHITQYLAAVTASLTFLNFGIYQGWPGPALVKILSDEYPISVDQEEASIVATIGTVGHVIGGFTASYLADHIGRKTTIMGIGLPQILWPMLIYWSYYSKYLLYIARIVGGIGEGASIAVVGTYIAETVVPTVRGVLGGFTTVCVGLGVFIINIAGSFLTLKESAIVMSVFPVIFWYFIHVYARESILLLN
ncbi:facilitated trehalose transporter Tret1-like isoform X2 [Sitophilus oryzae]|uniref:Facilitated trehalose transporter Tret1-like isoform X2 n=1 Tax=Sitophilus oryzae TaxID=7048 RepID=A0A6J2YBQ5_SITOR|nr:facilitated trehalose transporter Tret1-like isoform X2 [Sitophilus oryzae]